MPGLPVLHDSAKGSGRALALAAANASLIALVFLGLAWELWLAPLRPGGSWLVLKVLPLLLPLRGLLHGRRHACQWAALLIWAYFAEGVVRAWTDRGVGAALAGAEIALSLGFFAAIVAYLRPSRSV